MGDQFYLFTVPGDELVWAEMFTAEGHYVAPTPHTGVQDALSGLRGLHPGATVDELCLEADLDQAREWAAECPLEPLPSTVELLYG